jgi:hypothetical protein
MFTETIVTRLPIPQYPFRAAMLDELGLWLAEAEEVTVFLFVVELRAGAVVLAEVAVVLVVEGLRIDAAGEEEL